MSWHVMAIKSYHGGTRRDAVRCHRQAIDRVLKEKALAESVHAETMRQLELDRAGTRVGTVWHHMARWDHMGYHQGAAR